MSITGGSPGRSSTVDSAARAAPTSTSTTLADLFERSTERSAAVGTSIRRRTSESGDDGASDRGQRRLWRAVGGFFFPRSLQQGGGFAGRRRRSSSSTRDDGGRARSAPRSDRGRVLP